MPRGIYLGLGGDPSREQERPLITLDPQCPYQRLAQMKHFPYLPSRVGGSTGALQYISPGHPKAQKEKD